MKKVFMFAALILGTSVMVNAQTPVKAVATKELKHAKKADTKIEKKIEVTKTETTKPEAVKKVMTTKTEMTKKK